MVSAKAIAEAIKKVNKDDDLHAVLLFAEGHMSDAYALIFKHSKIWGCPSMRYTSANSTRSYFTTLGTDMKVATKDGKVVVSAHYKDRSTERTGFEPCDQVTIDPAFVSDIQFYTTDEYEVIDRERCCKLCMEARA